MFPFGGMLLSPLFYKMGTEPDREEEKHLVHRMPGTKSLRTMWLKTETSKNYFVCHFMVVWNAVRKAGNTDSL